MEKRRSPATPVNGIPKRVLRRLGRIDSKMTPLSSHRLTLFHQGCINSEVLLNDLKWPIMTTAVDHHGRAVVR